MGRRVFILLIFLVAGAVVNVAVAWGLAAWTFGAPTDIVEAGMANTKI